MKKNKWVRRGCLGAGCLLLAAFLAFGPLLRGSEVYAIDSLPHVEKIIEEQSAYTILEIVPAVADSAALTGYGALGYYVPGSEPTQDWAAKLAAVTGQADRVTAANALFDGLAAAGILGRGTDTPLRAVNASGAYYQERYVWDPAGVTGWTALNLTQEESTTVSGAFREKTPDDDGSFYSPVNDYQLVGAGGTGEYVQNIVYLTHQAAAPAAADDYYYYDPAAAFTPIEWDKDTGALVTEGLDPKAAAYLLEEGVYTPVGRLGDTILQPETPYYYLDLTKLGRPSQSWSAANCYSAPKTTGFRAPLEGETACFRNQLTGYRPAAAGSHVFVPGAPGSAQATVYYRTVYYKGGYTNNQWLLSGVFDLAASESSRLNIRVNSYPANRVTQMMVQAADMIVLSAGFDPAGAAAGGYLPGAGATASDLSATSDAAALEIARQASGSSKTPVVVDWRLANAADDSRLRTLARFCLSGNAAGAAASLGGLPLEGWSAADADHNYVARNVYCFAPDSEASALATGSFRTAFADVKCQAGFADALTEILNENFLRERDGLGASAMLEERISMATAIRYIINYAGTRVTASSSTVRVLELQPATANTSISKPQVYQWLGSPAALSDYASRAGAITITTMSMAEFVGRIEDLVENYDLIYVGDSTTGLNIMSNGTTNYNDNDMDGLLYSNIGDKYVTNYLLTGLLDRDFSSSTFYHDGTQYRSIQSGDTTRTFRFSGNDLTASKAQELRDFARAGYPIVLANDLVTSKTESKTVSYSVAVTGTAGSSNTTLTATVTGDIPEGQRLTYTWRRVGATKNIDENSTTSKTDTISVKNSDYVDKQLYCVVSLSGGITSATSNQVTIKKSTSSMTIEPNVVNKQDITFTVSGSTRYTATATSDPDNGWQSGTPAVTITAAITPALPAGVTITGYQWEYRREYTYTWYDYTGTGSRTAVIAPRVTSEYPDVYYRCTISLSNGEDLDTNSINIYSRRNWGSSGTQIASSGSGEYTDIAISSTTTTLSVTASAGTPSGGNVTLSAAVTGSAGLDVSYEWRRTDDNDWDDSNNSGYSSECAVQLSNNSTRYYRVQATVHTNGRTYTAYSNVIKITRGGNNTYTVSAVEGSSGTTGSFTAQVPIPGTLAVDPGQVDRVSKLYEALSAVISQENVMAQSDVSTSSAEYAANAATLYRYLNLSKPRIDWVPTGNANCLRGYPTVYSLSEATNTTTGLTAEGGKYYLRYSFKIVNATDPTPATTSYDCRLYIDSNSNGLYETNERAGDIEVFLNGRMVSPVAGAFLLKADTVYTITREMPEDYVGILPWKLEVVKSGADYVHASEHGYTHISPSTKKTIRILQITHNSGSGMDLSSNGTYQNLLKGLPDFSVKIDTIWANRLDTAGSWKVDGVQCDTRLAFFQKYDMLILGFYDAYREISDAAAADILSFSQTRAVLFTHDTTSIVNLPFNYYSISDGGSVNQPSSYFWGYSFNTILRSAVGLDRYGVTDATYGRSKMYRGVSGGIVSSASYLSLTEAQKETLTEAGYTIAYAPKSLNTSDLTGYAPQTLAETQGFTSYTLVRYSNNTGQLKPTSGGTYSSGNNITSSVVQVNEGQITTYPFNLNSTAFGGSRGNLSTADTHEQYYQLNLNDDDVVVWYCLSGGVFNTLPRDVVNSYYIYTKGNITYSGAGHSGASVTDDEAKLFINTMIAAFRSAAQKPTVAIKNGADGSSDLTTKYFTVEYSEQNGGAAGSMSDFSGDVENRTVYFRITDPSLTSSAKTMTAEFSYQTHYKNHTDVAGEWITFTPAATSYTGQPSGGSLLWMVLPDISQAGPLNELNKDEVASVTLRITVTTTIAGSSLTSDPPATLELRKVGLFPLG